MNGGFELPLMQLLIKAGAKTDIVDEHGNTALHCASEGGHIIIVKVLALSTKVVQTSVGVQNLLRAKADKTVRNKAGESAFDIICRKPPPPQTECKPGVLRQLRKLLAVPTPAAFPLT